MHRGLAKAQSETLPEIPFRLHPRPGSPAHPAAPPSSSSAAATTIPLDSESLPAIMVDAATSPLFPSYEDLNLGSFRTPSPDASYFFGSTFLTDRDLKLSVKDLTEELAYINTKDATMTGEATSSSTRAKHVTEEVTSPRVTRAVKDSGLEGKGGKRVLKEKAKPTIVEPIARSVSFCERPRRSPVKQFRDYGRFHLVRSTTSTNLMKVPGPSNTLLPDSLPPPPPPSHPHYPHASYALPPPSLLPAQDTARTGSRQESPRKRTSSSISDATEIGSIFSWHDKEFERRTALSLDMRSENIGPTSFFPMKKSKSLLDLLKPTKMEDTDSRPSHLNAFSQKQRLNQLSLRKGHGTFRRNSSLNSEEVDKDWQDIVNTQVIDDADYEKFASRRKPVTPSTKKRPILSPPKGAKELKYSQAENGKVYPMFVNMSAQAKKFGRALHHNRKLLKSK